MLPDASRAVSRPIIVPADALLLMVRLLMVIVIYLSMLTQYKHLGKV
jgi:hypothetical protein